MSQGSVFIPNFIQRNIELIRSSKAKAVSIERTNPKFSSPKYRSMSKNAPLNDRIAQLEKKLYSVQNNYQEQIIEQLSVIKEDIKLIKSHIFDRGLNTNTFGQSNTKQSEKQQTQESAQDDEPYFGAKQRMKSQSSEHDSKVFERHLIQTNKIISVEDIILARVKRNHSNYHKNSIPLKTVSSIVREYKLESPEFGTLFYGYSKRTSLPIVAKYAAEGLGSIIEIYDKLWKNIAMAKWPCVNRVLDFKREDSSCIILEKNKRSIVGLPPKAILIDVLKILEFIHDCGYLYKNVEPEHFMLNEEGQLVVIDFKRARRYIDIRGHALEVVDTYNGSPFASNNQLRGLPESKRDDLQSLGYLALLLLEMEIPWFGSSKEHSIRIRSSLTLQELYKNNRKWVEYMAVVMKSSKTERPNYKLLLEILEYS